MERRTLSEIQNAGAMRLSYAVLTDVFLLELSGQVTLDEGGLTRSTVTD